MEPPFAHDIKKGWGIGAVPRKIGTYCMTSKISLLPLALGLGLTLAGCDTVTDAATGAADATASAVGSVASALDPTGWFGDDEPTEVADNSGVSTDSAADTTPDLANFPSRPATTAPAQSQAAAQSLAADGAQARYSADSLRAGAEASATPPGAAESMPQMAMAAPDAPPTTDMGAPPPSAQGSAAVAPPPAARPAAPPPQASMAAGAPPPSALTQGTAAVPVAGGAQMAAAAPAYSASASAPAAARPPGAQPAVPANTPSRGAAMGTQYASDAQLGFQPSAAPPLDASINQWVSQPVVARYRQAASRAGIAPVRQAAVPAVAPKGGMGGPEAMSGAVTANLDAVSVSGSAIASMGGTPTATVFFPGDGTTISAAARAQIRAAAEQYKSMGGAGTIRVVGHASSRTANMPVDRHLTTIFNKSQDYANAVGQELIRQGVPAARVLIEAVGDSQPVYYESMPQGEEGNRRAEIFVQG